MYAIKLECDEVSVCRGCLSTDRSVFFVAAQLELFLSLLGVQRQFCGSQVALCWECLANLKKIQKFQNRIQHAQFILHQSLYAAERLPISTLSSMKIVRTYSHFETVVYKETVEYDEEQSNIRKEETPLLSKDVKQEEYDVDEGPDTNFQNDDDSSSENEVLTIDSNKREEIDEEPKIKKENCKKKNDRQFRNQSIRKYESKATVKKLDVDVEELKKLCGKIVLSEKEIEDLLERDKGHRKMHNKCLECKNTYRRSVDLKRHETFNHVKHKFPTKCAECKASICSWETLETHWMKHNMYYKCGLCGWLSHSVPSMTRHHIKEHTKLYCCNSCDCSCRTLREFSNHYKEIHEKKICDHCSKTFLKKRSLETHIKRHHTPAYCYECNRTYRHYHVLENHYRMYHPHLVRADTRTELAYCVECDKQFPSVYKYRRHLATAAKHTPPKPVRIPCPECGKVFARKIRMTNHYNSVHVNTTKHRCDICNKSFCSAFSARTHRQHVHEKIPMPKNKMCDICGRGFSTNRILTNHRRTHTGERPYKCPYCPATFAQRTAMKTHERTQHKRAPDLP